MDINVLAPMKLTKRLLPDMIARKSGHFIFLARKQGKWQHQKRPSTLHLSMHILGYANALRMEVAPFGIHVTTINPGPIDTPFLDLPMKLGTTVLL